MKHSHAILLALTLGGCGGVRHATRPDKYPDAKDPSLVEVRTTGFDGPTRTVSYSTWDVDPSDELPAQAPADVVDEMREEAAKHGADMLLLERVEDAWRKVWLGLGVIKDALAGKDIPVCGQPGFQAAHDDAKARAVRCTKGLLYERPTLIGEITVAFEVDPTGRVLRAAPMPDSSRDSAFQECVVGAVHATAFGEPLGFSCQGRVTVQVVDLHIDTFIPPRLPLVRYDITKRHERVFLGGRFFGHLDIPRVLDSGLSGGMWSITTNPFRRASRRWLVFQKNLERFRAVVAGQEGRLELVRDLGEYRAARARGAHAVLLSIQGGNALEKAPHGIASVPSAAPGPSPIVRVTLVHLTNAAYGITSSPFRLWKGKRGLTELGRDFVRHLNEHRVFVDLAHINERGFWDAHEVHDKSQPLIATHTGVSGVKPHWRNLNDAQLKAIADTGGVIGIVFAKIFLKVRGAPDDAGMIVDHMAHVANVAGDDAVAIGSDYDGAIVPPKDLRSGLSYVRLVQKLLDRGFSEARVQKFLGLNFLRSLEALRG